MIMCAESGVPGVTGPLLAPACIALRCLIRFDFEFDCDFDFEFEFDSGLSLSNALFFYLFF